MLRIDPEADSIICKWGCNVIWHLPAAPQAQSMCCWSRAGSTCCRNRAEPSQKKKLFGCRWQPHFPLVRSDESIPLVICLWVRPTELVALKTHSDGVITLSHVSVTLHCVLWSRWNKPVYFSTGLVYETEKCSFKISNILTIPYLTDLYLKSKHTFNYLQLFNNGIGLSRRVNKACENPTAVEGKLYCVCS